MNPDNEHDNNEPSSSPCQMADTDPAYHGFLPRDDVLALLNELLRAERAGARICRETLQQPEAQPWATFLDQVRQDETASCHCLMFSVLLLGARPATGTGDFYEKCMAISDVGERLQLLDKGQRWVVRKVTEALPKINHAGVREQLQEVLQMHEKNRAEFGELSRK